MAMYHFRIKSDKDKKGKPITGLRHATYINREGKYAETNDKNILDTKYQNIISGINPIENIPEQERIIYSSPFGNIKQDKRGIMISKNASPITIATAIEIAKKIYKKISINGDNDFQKNALRIMTNLEIDANFTSSETEKKLKIFKEEYQNERKQFKQNGGKFVKTASYPIAERKTPFSKFNAKLNTIRNLAEGGFPMSEMPSSKMAISRTASLLLSDDKRLLIHGRRYNTDEIMRWDNGWKQRITSQTSHINNKAQALEIANFCR